MKAPKKNSPSPKSSPGAKRSRSPARVESPMEAVFDLWQELDRIPAGEPDNALRLVAVTLRKLLKADNVKWVAAVRVLHGTAAKRDPMLGWRLRANYILKADPAKYRKLIAWLYLRNNRPEPNFQIGLATEALAAGAAKFQVHRMRDGWIPFREFSKSEHYRLHYTELGITDRMWLSFPLNAHTLSVFLVDRVRSRQHFSKQDAQLAATLVRGIPGFHRRLLLSRGLLIGEYPLSPVFQRIVQKLLTGLTEREIALSLNQSVATTHKYIKTLYERYGVNGRAALMSLWLGT